MENTFANAYVWVTPRWSGRELFEQARTITRMSTRSMWISSSGCVEGSGTIVAEAMTVFYRPRSLAPQFQPKRSLRPR